MFSKHLARILSLLISCLLIACTGDGSNAPSQAPQQTPTPKPQVEMVDLMMWEWDQGNLHEIYVADLTDGLTSRFTCARGWDRMPTGNGSYDHVYLLSDRAIYNGVPGRRLYRQNFVKGIATEVKVGASPKDNYDAFAISPNEEIVIQVQDGDYPSTKVFKVQTGELLYTRKGCWGPHFSHDGTHVALSCIPVLRDRRDAWDPVRIEVLKSETGTSMYGSAGWSQAQDPKKATKVAGSTGDDGATYNSARFSPDGTKIAYSYYQPGSVEQPQIHVRDLKNETTFALTKATHPCLNPIWSPDGAFIFYSVYVDGQTRVMKIPSSGGEAKAFGPSGGKIRNLASWRVPKTDFQSWSPCGSVPAPISGTVPGVEINQDPKSHVYSEAPTVAHKLKARFEYQLSMIGFELKKIEPEPKHLTLLARILFEVHHRPPGNFEVGLELKSPAHTITKKFSPLPGDWAPYRWEGGQYVLGEYALHVGYDIPPGTYFMSLWLYSPRGNIPILESDGHLHDAENTMPLGSIILN